MPLHLKVKVEGPQEGIVKTSFVFLPKSFQVTIACIGQRVTQTKELEAQLTGNY